MPWQVDDERGAQAVEFALLFAFVIGPMLYGIIGFGFALHQKITMAELAREAARIQAICLSTGTGCPTSAQTRALSIYSGPAPTWTWAATSCSATSGYSADVSVTVSVGAIVPMPSFLSMSTIRGTATAPCGG